MRPIGDYRPLAPWRTAGSGSARWCIADLNGREYFVKQFLRPVYPTPGDRLRGPKLARCREFEARKRRLYAALACVIGDTLVPVLDFFRCDNHYYAVSEAVRGPRMTGEEAHALPEGERRAILADAAACLQRLHLQGIVHADVKPEHLFVLREPLGCRARLIDLDSGFLRDDPPPGGSELEGDPVYLAPETYLRMTGRGGALDTRLDVFAFGAALHRVWTGELPGFDRQRYDYLFEAALDGAPIAPSPALPEGWRGLVARMLARDPDERPSDAEIVAALGAPREREARERDAAGPINGLSRYLRG